MPSTDKPKPPPAQRRRRDGGLPFVMVPVILIGRVSPMAFATYAAIAAHTSAREGTAWPGLPTLADELTCTVRTVRRAIAELMAAGVLESEARYRPDGSQTSNAYRLVPLGPVDDLGTGVGVTGG